MPGTIQVSILELVGLPSASQSSSMGIKVKVGKKAYEAQDKGDFSFPLASLRDNVNVSVHDSEGNEIAHTAVDTRSIVEKGIWDDLFALKGGGHVHMRLVFILTENELKRIRSMRDTATRKKREDLLTRSQSSSDLAFASVDSSKTTTQAEKQYKNLTDNQVKNMTVVSVPVQKTQATPAFTTSKSTATLDKLQVNLKEVIQPRDKEKQSALDKTPSDVRNRILAFEAKPVKEASPPISETRAVPQISTVIVYSPPRLPSLKKMIGENVKPAPIIEGPRKAREENRDYGRSMYEEQLVQKSEKHEVLKPQNVDYMSSKIDMTKLQPTREEKTEEKSLKLQNVDYMPSEKDVPKMQPTREEQKVEKKDLKLDNINDMSNKEVREMQPTREEPLKLQKIDCVSSEKEIPRMQPTREEKKEEKDLELQNSDYVSSEKDVSKIQPTVELLKLPKIDYMSRKKDIPEVQPVREEQKGKDSNIQNIDYVPREKDIAKTQPTREEQKPTKEEPKEDTTDLKLQNILYVSSEKDIPKVQPGREEQKGKDSNIQNIDYVSREKDIAELQPTREEEKPTKEEPKEEKTDLKLQNILYVSSEKDIPKVQPAIEEQKEEKNDLKLQIIVKDILRVQPAREEKKEEKNDLKLLIIEKDIPRVQPAREEQKEEKNDLKLQLMDYASSKKDIHRVQPTREEQHEEKKELKVQNIGDMSTKKDNSKIQPTSEEQNENKISPTKLCLSSTAESRYSWGGLVRAFPSRTHTSPDISTEQQRSHDPFVVEKNWRSKHWTSIEDRVKYSETYGDGNYISDRFSDWIFLEEKICSCIPNDDRPYVDLLQGCTARCNSERSQAKVADNFVSPDICEKSHVPSKKSYSGSSPNEGDSGNPIGQAMKIAIMVGFGFLVFLTRQRS